MSKSTDRRYKVPFTQYVRPNGFRIVSNYMTTLTVQSYAFYIRQQGYSFTVELLSRDLVNASIVPPDPDEPGVRSIICSNGPEVATEIDNMIVSFYDELTSKKGKKDDSID